MKSSTKPFPKTKIQWLWENMEGKRALYLIGMIGTVLYIVLQLTIPYFSGKIVDLFLTGENAVQKLQTHRDLFYRLLVFGITVPPLRDCQEDILPLAEFFREIANKELECNVSGFSSEARKALLTHAWPGNVRELRQKIMGAV